MCGRLQTSSLPGVHHRPLHGVPASCSLETLPQHAAVHLRDSVKEGNQSWAKLKLHDIDKMHQINFLGNILLDVAVANQICSVV